MTIEQIANKFSSFKSIQPIDSEITPVGQATKAEKGGFGNFLKNAVEEINKAEETANSQVADLTTGKPGVSVHGAMLALEKADLSFQLMNSVRSKIISAYQEVMRTQI